MFRNFVESGFGALEWRLCELLGKTPDEIGKYRKESPDGYNFLVYYIIHQAKEQEKQMKKMKAAKHSGKHH
jgi:hypothetical protein